jgi:hypothetical protein
MSDDQFNDTDIVSADVYLYFLGWFGILSAIAAAFKYYVKTVSKQRSAEEDASDIPMKDMV